MDFYNVYFLVIFFHIREKMNELRKSINKKLQIKGKTI